MSNWFWYARIWLASRILGKHYYFYLVQLEKPGDGQFHLVPVAVPDPDGVADKLS